MTARQFLARFRYPNGKPMNSYDAYKKVGHSKGVQPCYILEHRQGIPAYIWGPDWMETEGLDAG